MSSPLHSIMASILYPPEGSGLTLDQKILKLEDLLRYIPEGQHESTRQTLERTIQELRAIWGGGIQYRVWIGKKGKRQRPYMTIQAPLVLKRYLALTVGDVTYRICRIKGNDVFVKVLEPLRCTRTDRQEGKAHEAPPTSAEQQTSGTAP
jgi:hypothetical protein